MSVEFKLVCHSRESGNPVQLFDMQLVFVRYAGLFFIWIPAFVGMTGEEA